MIAAEDLKVGMTLVVTDTQEPCNYENGDTLEVTLLHPNTRLITGKLESGAVLKFCFEEVSKIDSTTTEPEAVSHPQHYGGDTTYEAIKVIEAWGLGFHTGNATKYISRAGKKDKAKEIEDIDKAIWYLQRHKANLEAASA